LQTDIEVNQFEARSNNNSQAGAVHQSTGRRESCNLEVQPSARRRDIVINSSEFDNIEDYVDDQEECGSDQKAIRFSIRCLDFQMMMPAPQRTIKEMNEQQS